MMRLTALDHRRMRATCYALLALAWVVFAGTSPAADFTGSVVDVKNNPIPGLEIYLHDRTAWPHGPTDTNGNFKISSKFNDPVVTLVYTGPSGDVILKHLSSVHDQDIHLVDAPSNWYVSIVFLNDIRTTDVRKVPKEIKEYILSEKGLRSRFQISISRDETLPKELKGQMSEAFKGNLDEVSKMLANGDK